MDTKKMKGAMSQSMKAETRAIRQKQGIEAIEERCDKADAFFGDTTPSFPPEPLVKDQVKALVRDSFTFPREDHGLIQKIMDRCLQQGIRINKSEVLRIALQRLDGLSADEMREAVSQLQRVKTGRPTNSLQKKALPS